MIIRLILIKTNIKKTCENVKQCHASHFFPILGGEDSFFPHKHI